MPFGPHPHRGFETVTFVLDGDVLHKDSGGHQSIIRKGGVQWMTAGSGLIHSEVSSDEFKQNGGNLEILQLWVNLPAKFKMTPPQYVDLQKEDMPAYKQDGMVVQVVSGGFNGIRGAYQSLTDVHLALVYLEKSSQIPLQVPSARNVFFYIIKGELRVNGQPATALHLIEFENDGEEIQVETSSNATILFGHALPYHEPFVAQGPFVMNTQAEIQQAYQDYSEGKLGIWKA